ncbi:CPBP family intramembrane glutamic endopeptidase [Anaerosacchariphilus polymeriproducens]|uniref:CPBP family intramembrane metalloprotease n=1 Tax=Anaerosacchariphilus polymeriproducens TaxID=1812858 RepID=A0A371AWP9_9FIRM|nr:CPBP family intramembrane glutamic endopeptidase [Anaerosacchariphilus polymeriproducens]RDU23971.1 CPBP family intramembrane metalloprotease [Anaerosacchariphilus polymeriproducens]
MKQENIIVKIWRILYPLGIYFGITQVVSFLSAFIIMIFIYYESMKRGITLNVINASDQLSEKLIQNGLYITLIAAIITIPILLIFYKRDKKRSFFINELPAKIKINDFAVVLLLAVSGCIFFNGLVTISNIAQYSKMYQQVSKIIFDSGIIVEVLAAGIFAPIVEEILFRGILYKRLKEYINPIAGIIISSLLFGIYHFNLVQFVYASLLGCILGYLMEKYKNIKVPILAHIGANMTAILLTECKPVSDLYKIQSVFLAVTICAFFILVLSALWIKKGKFTYGDISRIEE